MVHRANGPAPEGDPGEHGSVVPAAEPPVYILSRRAAREIDRLAAEQFGIPSIVLMENAAFHTADLALHLTEYTPTPAVLIVCGPGNNGGDGLAAARHLHNAGATIEILLIPAANGRAEGDAATNLAIAERMNLPITRLTTGADEAFDRALARLGRPDLVIDALLGTGLDRSVREPAAGLIGRINDLGREGVPVLAVDIPSGLDADSGEPLGTAVRATVSITFAGLKAGFTRLSAQEFLGEVVVSDIGAPRELTERLGELLVSQEELHEGPPVRPGHEPAAAPPERRPDRP